jgi:hypothetical protein
LPENPDTTLWQINRAVKRTVAEGISAAKAIRARSAVALVAEGATAGAKTRSAAAGAAVNATAEKAISVSAEDWAHFHPPPFPAQTPRIINT